MKHNIQDHSPYNATLNFYHFQHQFPIKQFQYQYKFHIQRLENLQNNSIVIPILHQYVITIPKYKIKFHQASSRSKSSQGELPVYRLLASYKQLNSIIEKNFSIPPPSSNILDFVYDFFFLRMRF